MKDQRKTEIRVGVTVVAGILIFIWILGWAKNFSLNPSENYLFINFNNTSGLEIGDEVTVNGVRKGNVEEIKVDDQSVIVKISLDNDVKLKEDAKFGISMLDLMGGKKVEILPGTSANFLDISKVQKGIFNADIPAVMTLVGSMQNDITQAVKDINVTLSSLNKYLTDQKMQKDVKQSMSNLNALTSKINIMIDENRESVKKLTSNTVDLTDEAKSFITENKTNIKASIDKLNDVLTKTDSLLSKTNLLVDETKNQKNNLGKLLYDENTYKNLNETLNQVNELTKIILKQIQDDGIKVDANIF